MHSLQDCFFPSIFLSTFSNQAASTVSNGDVCHACSVGLIQPRETKLLLPTGWREQKKSVSVLKRTKNPPRIQSLFEMHADILAFQRAIWMDHSSYFLTTHPHRNTAVPHYLYFYFWRKSFLPSFLLQNKKILSPIQRNWKQNFSDLALQFAVPPACFWQMHTLLNKMFLWWCSDSLGQRKIAGGKGIYLYVSLSPKCGYFL